MKIFTFSNLLFAIFLLSVTPPLSGQQVNTTGSKVIKQSGEQRTVTTAKQNKYDRESMQEHLQGWKSDNLTGRKVLGGNLLWSAQDPDAIASHQDVSGDGTVAATAWTLNNMRISYYSEASGTPLWEYVTNPNDGYVSVSDDGSVVAESDGNMFRLLDPSNGTAVFEIVVADSFRAGPVKVSRDGSLVVFLASAQLGNSISRVYAIDPTGTPSVLWMKDFNEASWTGVNISADNSHLVVNSRYQLYVLNSSDGSTIWTHFIDNTESPVAISGDGQIIVTADLSGYVITRSFDDASGEYVTLWEYHVPAGIYINWAYSPSISADGTKVLAGSLLFLSGNEYNGSVMAFDTFSGGEPVWIYPNTGDLVTGTAISDDGSVAAVSTWGDISNTLPDLLVFDVASGDVTFEQNSPGSFFSVDISNDGKRVYAGGKAVHARVFGNGGAVYFVDINLGGGFISGTVDLTNSTDDSGVLVEALGTTRSAVTNADGSFLIPNIPAGTYDLKTSKPGYNFGGATNISVADGDTTSGVSIQMDPFNITPPTLTASQGLNDGILLMWSGNNSKNVSPQLFRFITDPVSFSGELDELNPRSTLNGQQQPGTLSNLFEGEQITNTLLGIDSIAIYKGIVSGGPYNKIASLPVTESSYLDSAVLPLRNYYYVISVFNDLGESVYSNEAMGSLNDSLLIFDFDVPYQTSSPVIDGIISPGEWDDAIRIDVSDALGYDGNPKPLGSAYMYFKLDTVNKKLYVAGEDFLNTALDDNEGFGLYFDDNHNGTFDSTYNFIEGNFWAYWHPSGADLRFRKIPEYTIRTIENAEVGFSDASGYLQGEVAIPLGFFEGYQVQIYGPDKKVGLGAFIVARQSGQPIFDGWWPQDMHSIFNPLYFANVGVDVSLIAPPKPPTNISVEKQGLDLLITWTDPTEGINNDPLPVQPELSLYRNGTLLQTFQTGVQTYLDNDVVCNSWYEYSFKASITIDTLEMTGPESQPVGNFSCEDPPLTPISYDDGSWEAFFVVDFNYDDNKFGILFTPTFYPTRVMRIETLVNSTAEFDLTIQDNKNGLPEDTLAGPYRVHAQDAFPFGTLQFTLPGEDPPLLDAGEFWVVINYLPESPGAPGIGVDNSSPNQNRGMYYTATNGWQDFTFGNLMVTSYITSPVMDVENNSNDLLPKTFSLEQNYPNPFNPSTIVRYEVPKSTFVSLKVYNITGQLVTTLVNEEKEPGRYSVNWDASNVSSGVYFIRMTAGTFNSVKKAVLLK